MSRMIVRATVLASIMCIGHYTAFGEAPDFLGEVTPRSYPVGFDAGEAGTIYSVGSGYPSYQVEKMGRDGTLLAAFGSAGTNPGQFGWPADITIDRDGMVYVLDYNEASNSYRVQEFTCNGQFVRSWQGFQRGKSVAVDSTGNVYVATSNSWTSFDYNLDRFAPDGSVSHLSISGSGIQYPSSILGLDVSPRGTVYIFDAGNSRVEYFSAEGQLMGRWGSYGSSQGQFRDGGDLAVDASGNVYVADRGNNRIQEFNATGAFLASWGSPGSGPGQISYPGRIDIDQNSTVYVMNYDGRIERFGRGNLVGVYVDPAGEHTPLSIPRNVPTTLYVIATMGGATSGGITGAEFRIQVTNPAGYYINYTPPTGASAVGDPMDLTPAVPNDRAGTTVLFNACQPLIAPRNAGDRVTLGTLSVFNLVGGATDLLVQGNIPPNNVAMPCARFYRCDAPLFTTVCMSETSNPGIVSRTVLQSESSPPSPFAAETLALDANEAPEFGAAGPVATCQELRTNESYLVTVTGTLSLWGATHWGLPPDVICGFPEAEPQTPSPWITNGWVGADAEVIFSVPLPPNGDCGALDSQGFPRHPGRFLIDCGTGFSHVEPMGGQPSDPSPGHMYKYLVQGQGKPARFSYLDDSTADNYGVLNITVERATTNEVLLQGRSTGFTTLPNIPDPFNPSTQVRYSLPVSSQVRLAVYDVSGHLVRILFNGLQPAGYQSVRWDGRRGDGSQAPSGVYFARIVATSGSGTEKMVLLK